jgi:nitrogen fixation protein FixH
MDTIKKQAYEEFTIAGDFVDQAESGETAVLVGSEILAIDKDGVDVKATLLDQATKAVDDTQLKIKLRAGTADKSPYKITFKIVTSAGNRWEIDVSCRVKEI